MKLKKLHENTLCYDCSNLMSATDFQTTYPTGSFWRNRCIYNTDSTHMTWVLALFHLAAAGKLHHLQE
jgi:hypothetical protein